MHSSFRLPICHFSILLHTQKTVTLPVAESAVAIPADAQVALSLCVCVHAFFHDSAYMYAWKFRLEISFFMSLKERNDSFFLIHF